MLQTNLKQRTHYLNQLLAFQDTELVKVITGIRRCGKSSLMQLMIKHLKAHGIDDPQFIVMNFESMEYQDLDAKALYHYVKNIRENLSPDKKLYLFFDEIQRVPKWQDAVNSFRVDFLCDIYITGSNASLLSSELSTYLSGRYVEIKMLPLSFREFIEFHGYRLETYTSLTGDIRKRVKNAENETIDLMEIFEAYMRFGGMPGIAEIGLQQDKVFTLLDGIYSTVVVRDILERERRRGQRQITDADLLRKIIMFLADNIGSNISLNSISNTLVSEKLLEDRSRKGKPAVQTIQAYVCALLESFVFYEIKRFDIKGKDYLRTLGKYYIVDIGLRNYLLGYREMDTGHAIENIVYFELLRRGYDVAIRKIDNKEVDFIATKTGEKRYIQVTEDMRSETVREREFSPLRQIRDNYEKNVIALSCNIPTDHEGIKMVRLMDFLLESYC